MIILGIESSCDETSIAVLKDGKEILSNNISSQIEIHKEYKKKVESILRKGFLYGDIKKAISSLEEEEE